MRRGPRELQQRFGKRVRALRERAGISQEQLALDAELDRTYISKIERGLGNPSLLAIAQLAATLKVDIRDLLMSL